MAVHATEPKKRKNPPSFRHLPRNRAQKLKKSWIERKKLKMRWKAEKLREGLDSGWPKRPNALTPQDDADPPTNVEEHPRMQNDPSHSDPDSDVSPASSGDDSAPERPPLPHRKAQTTVPQLDDDRQPSTKSKGKQKGRLVPPSGEDAGGKEEPEDSTPSLRELTRRAYSRSSFHTFKADPLHRRRDAFTSREADKSNHENHGTKARTKNEARAISSSRGGARGGRPGRGSHDEGRQSRGQPNMKLRMEAMLERIKRDYS